jgi:cardiolipin synthase
MAKDKINPIFTVPNVLSILRILLIPVFVVLLIGDKKLSAFFVFLFASLTDLLDGIAARIWHQKTILGTYLDPAADKLLMASTFIALSLPRLGSPNTLPLWLVLVVIIRDVYIVSGALAYIKLTGQTKVKPTLPGKACTVVEMGLLVLVLFFNALGKSPAFLSVLYIVTLSIVLISTVHYTAIGLRGLLLSREKKPRV